MPSMRLEDRAERLCNLAFDAPFATDADARLTLRYGVSLRRENTRSYKQMRDLLGAGYVTDIDQLPDRRRYRTAIRCRTTCGIPAGRSARATASATIMR